MKIHFYRSLLKLECLLNSIPLNNFLFLFLIRALIYYLYSGELNLTPGQCLHLLAYLDFYGLVDCERLNVVCEDKINNVTQETCWELLEVAQSYELKEIVDLVCSYLATNFNNLYVSLFVGEF
jgi:hypothetical protein